MREGEFIFPITVFIVYLLVIKKWKSNEEYYGNNEIVNTVENLTWGPKKGKRKFLKMIQYLGM
jgi:hypothetical protein